MATNQYSCAAYVLVGRTQNALTKGQSMRILTILLLILSAAGPNLGAQPGLPPNLRGAVYRIEQPGLYEGTAVMFVEKSYMFLITNLHVVTNDSGKVCDSVFLYVNYIIDNGEVISGPEHVTVYLKTTKDRLFFRPDIGNADIVLISVSTGNLSDNFKEKTFSQISTLVIPKLEQLNLLIDSNAIMTAIGFPSKRGLYTSIARYPEYRWGRCVGQNPSFLKMNIPVLPGSSGSPIFVEKGGEYFFVGIATLLVKRECRALRASAIRDCFARYFAYISRH